MFITYEFISSFGFTATYICWERVMLSIYWGFQAAKYIWEVYIFADPIIYILRVNPKMDMQKIVTLDGFGVCADPRKHFAKNATLNKNKFGWLVVKVLQTFQVVRDPRGPRISILGLGKLSFGRGLSIFVCANVCKYGLPLMKVHHKYVK